MESGHSHITALITISVYDGNCEPDDNASCSYRFTSEELRPLNDIRELFKRSRLVLLAVNSRPVRLIVKGLCR